MAPLRASKFSPIWEEEADISHSVVLISGHIATRVVSNHAHKVKAEP